MSTPTFPYVPGIFPDKLAIFGLPALPQQRIAGSPYETISEEMVVGTPEVKFWTSTPW